MTMRNKRDFTDVSIKDLVIKANTFTVLLLKELGTFSFVLEGRIVDCSSGLEPACTAAETEISRYLRRR